jgi:TonB family protein
MTPQTFNNGLRDKNGSIFKMIILSLTIHLIVLSVIIVTFPTTSRHLTFGQAYSVQLVGPEVMIPAKDLFSKDILQSEVALNSEIIKSEISKFSSPPVKNDEINKSSIEKAISAIKQKEFSEPTVAPSAKPSATAGGNVQAVQTSSRSDEYIGFITSRVRRNWTLPPELKPKDNVETIVDVKILRTGQVERLSFEKRSGNVYIDDSAMKAVQKSIPFPPFPDGMMDVYIEIGIRFHSSELR